MRESEKRGMRFDVLEEQRRWEIWNLIKRVILLPYPLLSQVHTYVYTVRVTSKSQPREVDIKNLVQQDISSLEPTDLLVRVLMHGYVFACAVNCVIMYVLSIVL